MTLVNDIIFSLNYKEICISNAEGSCIKHLVHIKFTTRIDPTVHTNYTCIS